jgi:hypothetical protein
VIDPSVERTLQDIHRLGVLGGYYLAGDTGLALHLVHRRSHDLDFFSGNRVDSETLIQNLKMLPDFALVAHAPGTLHATIKGVKVSFLSYPYPALFPFAALLGVSIADPRDITCMKLSAIASRGTKRDFVDLYATTITGGLAPALQSFKQKYAEVNYSLPHVLKSLIWFEDAEKEPMPATLIPLAGEDIKRFFRTEAARLSL